MLLASDSKNLLSQYLQNSYHDKSIYALFRELLMKGTFNIIRIKFYLPFVATQVSYSADMHAYAAIASYNVRYIIDCM